MVVNTFILCGIVCSVSRYDIALVIGGVLDLRHVIIHIECALNVTARHIEQNDCVGASSGKDRSVCCIIHVNIIICILGSSADNVEILACGEDILLRLKDARGIIDVVTALIELVFFSVDKIVAWELEAGIIEIGPRALTEPFPVDLEADISHLYHGVAIAFIKELVAEICGFARMVGMLVGKEDLAFKVLRSQNGFSDIVLCEHFGVIGIDIRSALTLSEVDLGKMTKLKRGIVFELDVFTRKLSRVWEVGYFPALWEINADTVESIVYFRYFHRDHQKNLLQCDDTTFSCDIQRFFKKISKKNLDKMRCDVYNHTSVKDFPLQESEICPINDC